MLVTLPQTTEVSRFGIVQDSISRSKGWGSGKSAPEVSAALEEAFQESRARATSGPAQGVLFWSVSGGELGPLGFGAGSKQRAGKQRLRRLKAGKLGSRGSDLYLQA